MPKKYENIHVDSGYIGAHGDIKMFKIAQKLTENEENYWNDRKKSVISVFHFVLHRFLGDLEYFYIVMGAYVTATYGNILVNFRNIFPLLFTKWYIFIEKTRDPAHRYGFGLGLNLATRTRTRCLTRAKPAGLPIPVLFTNYGHFRTTFHVSLMHFL